MKILISSIACQPGLGSEAKVGWDAILAIAGTHECHVITHSVSKDAIHAVQREGMAANVTFHFHGENYTWHSNRLIARIQSWLIYRKWQSGLLDIAIRLHRKHHYNIVHHLTYATWRVPSPLWQLPIPFVWGPIGGAAKMPLQFYQILSPSAVAFEVARNISTWISSRSKAFLECVQESTVVIAANQETITFLRQFRKTAPIHKLPVAFFSDEQVHTLRKGRRVAASLPGQPLRIFAGGNLIGSKGLALALKALALAQKKGISCHYTIAGGGPEVARLQRLTQSLGLTASVLFHSGYSGQSYIEKLQTSDVYLMPSFRETTPVTLLESILAGCFPIIVNQSAAGEILSALGGGIAVEALNVPETIFNLATALEWCFENKAKLAVQAAVLGDKVEELFCKNSYLSHVNSIYDSLKSP